MTKIEPSRKAQWAEMHNEENNDAYLNVPVPATTQLKDVQNVQLVRVELPFWNMVWFMVTAAFAAIPAIMIVFVLVNLLIMLTGGVGTAIQNIIGAMK